MNESESSERKAKLAAHSTGGGPLAAKESGNPPHSIFGRHDKRQCRLFMTGLPNAGKSTFVASLPILFGEDFKPDEESGHELRRYGEQLRNPRVTYKSVELRFTIRQLAKSIDHSFVMTDDGGEWLERAMDELGGQIGGENLLGKDRLRMIKRALNGAQGYLYIVAWDDLISSDVEKHQRISDSFHAFIKAIKLDQASPDVAIVVTRCDLAKNVLTENKQYFTDAFRSEVKDRVEKLLDLGRIKSLKQQVFPVTSLGFNNEDQIDEAGRNIYVPREAPQPIGGREAIRWLASRQSKSRRGFIFRLLAVFAALTLLAVILPPIFKPPKDPESVIMQGEFKLELAKAGEHDKSVADVARSIDKLLDLRSEWERKVRESELLTNDEQSKLVKIVGDKIDSEVEHLRGHLFDIASARVRAIEADPLDLNGVRSSFEVLPHLRRSLGDQELFDEITERALALAWRYRGIRQADANSLASILAEHVHLHGRIRKSLDNLETDVIQDWHREWRTQLRESALSHSNPVERFRVLRDLTKAHQEDKRFQNLSEYQRAEAKDAYAYVEFMVGPQKPTSGNTPYNRTITVEKIEVHHSDWYKHSRDKLGLETKVKVGGRPVLKGRRIPRKSNGVLSLARGNPITIQWQPGQDVQVELWSYFDGSWRPGESWSSDKRNIFSISGTVRYGYGQEILILNSNIVTKGSGRPRGEVRLRVAGLPTCPPLLQEILRDATAKGVNR